MANANVLNFSDSRFESDVLNSDVPVLVDFWAEWCRPCLALAPTLKQLAEDFAGSAKVGRLNVDENNKMAAQYSVSAIPTVILFNGGQVVERFIGLRPKKDYERVLNDLAPEGRS